MNSPAERHPQWPDGAERLYDAAQVAAAYDSLAGDLERSLDDPSPLLLAVMTGGLYPAAELSRRLGVALEIDYVHATRYRGQTSGGEIDWQRWPEALPGDRTIVVVDDIFDEGHTLAAIRERLQRTANPRRIITAVLALKHHDRGLPRDWVDLHGLEVPDRYVFGAGMDYRGRWRQVEEIWALPGGLKGRES